MTSEKVMLTAAVLALCGCGLQPKPTAEPLAGPYDGRRVWAVAPLLNESGSLQADGTKLADKLAQQLENASGLDVMPVNRTLAAIESLGAQQLTGPRGAVRLLNALGADALLVGTVTAYDPYDPPKLGLALELYAKDRDARPYDGPGDLRQLSQAATDDRSAPTDRQPVHVPVSVVSGFFDAADPRVRQAMQRYAARRGAEPTGDDRPVWQKVVYDTGPDPQWRHYRISMDLYSEFVAYAMARRILAAERERLSPPNPQPTP